MQKLSLVIRFTVLPMTSWWHNAIEVRETLHVLEIEAIPLESIKQFSANTDP